ELPAPKSPNYYLPVTNYKCLKGLLPRLPFDDPLDHRAVLLVAPDEREEFGRQDVVLLEEFPVAAAAVHERIGQLAPQFCARLREQPRQPGDALHRFGLGRQPGLVEDGLGGAAMLRVEKIIAADEFDPEGVLGPRLAVVAVVILGVVVQVLGRDAVGGEEGLLLRGEKGLRAALSLGEEPDRLVVQGAKSLAEIVVLHTAEASRGGR